MILATLIQTMAGQTPFDFVSTHIHMLGWGTVVVAAWKIAIFFSAAKQRVLKAENQIEQMATNHMPHVQDATAALVEHAKETNSILERIARGVEKD